MTDVAQGFTAGVGHSRGGEGTHGHVPGESSMWFFVIGDLLIFGVYFVVYMCYRTQHHDLFLRGQAQLNLDVGAVNTVMLLTSSLFVALGVAAARAGDAVGARRRFWAALTFGAVFPLLKLFEWIPEITAGLTPGKNLFFMFYFVMTGMHLCHDLLGLVILCFVIRNLKASSGLGAFRPGYSPAVLAMLYDFGYLAFIGSLGCFCVMWMAFGLAILLDTNNVLPKWLGYYTVWQYVTELIAAPVWIAKSGPFAWNGLMTFWFAMVLYVSWQIIVYVCIFRSIKNQPEAELDNAPPEVRAAALATRPTGNA
jgi:heme/copper-type cytochrome/quinol oxidase subunit 3